MPASNEPTGRNQNACTPERVAELAQQGHGRNAIARLLDVNVYQVHKAARAAGVTFDRKATRAATAARMADAHAERTELAEQFRQVASTILSKVLNSDPGELDPAALRDLLWSAGSAAASDARYGKLQLDHAVHQVGEEHESEAAENFAELLNTIRDGFRTLDEEDEEELQRQVDQADADYFDSLDQDDEDGNHADHCISCQEMDQADD